MAGAASGARPAGDSTTTQSGDHSTMDDTHRQLLREAFEELIPLPRRFGELFYRRLFELDPSLRPMFGEDLERQASMLVNALTVAVMNFLDQRRGARAVRELGARHSSYGVVDAHYETFGEALLWTFEQRFGERFTPALRAAWNEAWKEISALMMEASRGDSVESSSDSSGS